MSDVSLGTRPRYSLVVDEDVKKPTYQTNNIREFKTTLTRPDEPYESERSRWIQYDGDRVAVHRLTASVRLPGNISGWNIGRRLSCGVERDFYRELGQFGL